MSKFKIGDKVKIINMEHFRDAWVKLGEVGVIESKILDDIYVVRFEKNIQYVVMARENMDKNLELVEEKKNEM